MSAEQERGGIDPTDDEARALLSVLFAERTGDAVRALRAFGDLRVLQAIGAGATQGPDTDEEAT